MANSSLIKYDAMCRAIDQAHRVDEVKDLRDKAMALEHYARQAKNVQAERKACQVRLRAEKKGGRLLKLMAKSKERAGKGKPSKMSRAGTLNLTAIGISRNQSARWQKLADVPDEVFERALVSDKKPTTSGIIAAAEPPKVNPVNDSALWLWGCLRDFDKKYLAADPATGLATLTPIMLDDVRRLAPLVAQWLHRVAEEANHVKAQDVAA